MFWYSTPPVPREGAIWTHTRQRLKIMHDNDQIQRTMAIWGLIKAAVPSLCGVWWRCLGALTMMLQAYCSHLKRTLKAFSTILGAIIGNQAQSYVRQRKRRQFEEEAAYLLSTAAFLSPSDICILLISIFIVVRCITVLVSVPKLSSAGAQQQCCRRCQSAIRMRSVLNMAIKELKVHDNAAAGVGLGLCGHA